MRSRYYRQMSKVKISRLFVSGLICTMLLILQSVDKIEAATLQDFFDSDFITNENVRFDNWDLVFMTPGIELDRIGALPPIIGSINPTLGFDPVSIMVVNMMISLGENREGDSTGVRGYKPNFSQVPIPGGVWLLSSGLLILILVRRKNP